MATQTGVLAAGLVLALLGCGGTGAPSKPVTLNVSLRSDHYRLANGLEVVLHEDRTLRNVVVNVRYHVGSKDDPPGRSGFAHLFEHMMFLGSRHVSERSLTQALEDAGALAYNAHTTHDVTEYFEVVPPSELPVALWVEADRMAHPAERVEESSFAREREVVKNEWRERYDNAPYGHVWSFVRGGVFGEGHPYHLPPIGRPADLDRASLDDARSFAARFYTPTNATLIVAGNFDTPEARGLVERMFSAIAPGAPPAPRRFPFPRLPKDRRVVVEAGVETGRVIVAWAVPPPHARGWHEVQIAARGIAGMTAFKLQTQSKVARDIDWDLTSGRLGSMLSFQIDLERDADPDDAVAALETRVRWMTQFDYRWEEFVNIRTQRMTRSVFGLADLGARAERLQDYVEFYGRPDSARAELRHIQEIRAADAALAARELLHDRPKLVVVVKPTPSAPRSGRLAQ